MKKYLNETEKFEADVLTDKMIDLGGAAYVSCPEDPKWTIDADGVVFLNGNRVVFDSKEAYDHFVATELKGH